VTDMKAIHEFAVKWCDKFRDQKINYIELVDHFMADDCAALGFEMDCGHAFEAQYGSAVYDHAALDRVIDDVDDIPLLGSAIYSRWRYFNHWAYSGSEILEPENRAWFILALSRLANITGDNPFLFQGILQKIRIVSNCIGYGPVLNRMMRLNSTSLSMLKDGYGSRHISLEMCRESIKKLIPVISKLIRQ